MILTESINPFFTEVEITGDSLDESTKKKLPRGAIMTFNAKVGHAGKITANGRYYSKKLIEREVTRLQGPIVDKRVEGLYGHPNKVLGGTPDPARAAYLVTGLTMNEQGEVFMSGSIHGTRAGKDMAARIRTGAKIGFSARGGGSAEEVTLNDKHEAWSDPENHIWEGKTIEHVNEDYELRTYDNVIGQAIKDAEIHAYLEQREKEMSFDLKKLTEADWKEILESDQFKSALEKEKVVLAEDAKKHLMSDEFLTENKNVILKNVLGMDEEKLTKIVELLEKGEGAEDIEEAKVKCSECDGVIPSGAKFCPACGAATPSKDEGKTESEGDDMDNKFEELLKRVKNLEEANGELSEKNKALTENLNERDERDSLAKVVSECLDGKPAAICEAVKNDLEDLGLTSKTAEEKINKRVRFYEEFAKQTGGNLDQGVGAVKPKDVDEKTELTESEKHEADAVDVLREIL
jgi:hypothetical protein